MLGWFYFMHIHISYILGTYGIFQIFNFFYKFLFKVGLEIFKKIYYLYLRTLFYLCFNAGRTFYSIRLRITKAELLDNLNTFIL